MSITLLTFFSLLLLRPCIGASYDTFGRHQGEALGINFIQSMDPPSSYPLLNGGGPPHGRQEVKGRSFSTLV